MNYTITYLDNSTIICLDTGRVALIDENLKEWELITINPTPAGWLTFKLGPCQLYLQCATLRVGWYQHGILHRDNGPAIIWSNGLREWYQHGKRISEPK